MRVRIIKGHGWYKDKEGQEFDVFPDRVAFAGDVYTLLSDKAVRGKGSRFVNPENCELVPDLDAQVHALRARLTLACDLIDALTFGGTLSPNMMPPDTRALWERWRAEETK